MTRTLKIAWSGGKVTAKLQVADSPTAVLLAHGAGAGQDHRFMVTMRNGLAVSGVTTMTFNYAYTDGGRRAPDRLPRLLEVHHAAYERLRDYADRVVLAGKSMGGRVGSHLAGGVGDEPGRTGDELAGVVYLAYPLVPLGKSEPRSVEHLQRIDAPQLFIAGTRDRLSPPPLITDVAAALRRATVHVIDDADHGFHVPKRTGRTDQDVMKELIELVAATVA